MILFTFRSSVLISGPLAIQELGETKGDVHIPIQCLHQIGKLLRVKYLPWESVKSPEQFTMYRKLMKEQ